MGHGKLKGTIKSLKRVEGYGFIAHEATGIDHFFHRSSLLDEAAQNWDGLEIGQHVEFTQTEGPKGPRAVAIVLV